MRDKFGSYGEDDWQSFADAIGIRIYWQTMHGELRGYRIGNAIILRRGMSRRETNETAWHEIGHVLLHVGNWQFWDSLPLGFLVLRKGEVQADDWMRLFPKWEAE